MLGLLLAVALAFLGPRGTWLLGSKLATLAVDLKTLEHGCRFVCASRPSFFSLGLEGAHVQTSHVL